MYRRFLKTFLPLYLLGSSACISVPEIEDPGTQQPAGSFSLTLDPSQVSIFQGGSRSLQLTVNRTGGFSDSVTVQLLNPPAGISAPAVTVASGNTSATMNVSVGSNAEPGPKTLTLRGTAGTLTQDTTVTLTVARPGDLLVQWASPSQSKTYAKDSVQVQVVVEGGTPDTVDLYKGTEFLTRLSPPSYQYTWDTSLEAEGEYALTARASVGGSPTNSPVRTIVVDHTAPKVATRTPATGATSVSVRDALQVSFDEALKASTVTDASVTLSTAGGANVAKTLSLSTDGKTLTITPTTPLSLPADITITLGTGPLPLTDLAGNTLVSSSAWSFTVPAWLPMGSAISAVSGNTPAENVAMKVGTDGNPVIAWSESDGTAKNIYVRRWNGTSWDSLGTALSAVNGTGTDADRPTLAMDADNRPILVWDELLTSSGSSSNIFGRKWNGTSWDNLPAFSLGTDEYRYNPSIALDTSGNLLVSSFLNSGGAQSVKIHRLAPASTTWEVVYSTSGYMSPFNAQLATDASGNWFAALNFLDENRSATSRSHAVLKKSTLTSWTQMGAPVISPAQGNAGTQRAALTTDGNNQPIIAWQESDSTTSSIYAATWNGSSWQMIGNMVNTATLTNNTQPSMVVGNDGRPMIAWSGYTSPETSIRVSRWNGSNWQEVGAGLSAATGSTTSAFHPVLALDKNGQPLVAWQESDGAVSNVYVYRYNY